MEAEEIGRTAWRSERLVYRAFETEDDKAWWFAQRRDPDLLALSSTSVLGPPSNKACERVYEVVKGAYLTVLICLLPAADADADAKPARIGSMSLFQNGKDAGTQHHRAAKLGIVLLKPWQGMGYGGEAVNWALDWAFKRAGLHRVSLECFAYNTRAERMYRRLGFVEEGREREALFFDRKWWDVILFSMLEGEWEILRGYKV